MEENRNTWNGTRILLLLVGVILLAVFIGMLFIKDAPVNTDVTAHITKVGLLFPGRKDDANYSQSHYDSLMNIRKQLNLEIVCREGVPEDETLLSAVEDLIEHEGCRVIVAPSFGYGEYLMTLAKRYPDVCFLHPMGSEFQSNLTSCLGRMYQARYLAGIVAGLRTETDEIGYAAAFPISEVICQINAFTMGVKSVAPDANVHVTYINSWTDDEAAKAAAEKLLDETPDMDVLTMHTNSLMPDLVASKNGIWSIGFNRDNADRFPNSYLTACVWTWEDYYYETILSSLQGKFYGRNDLISMEDGVCGLSDLTANCAPGTEEAVAEAIRRFNSKSFDVFYGPVSDNNGTLRVPEGESMSDMEMQNRFDWYVEGVTVED